EREREGVTERERETESEPQCRKRVSNSAIAGQRKRPSEREREREREHPASSKRRESTDRNYYLSSFPGSASLHLFYIFFHSVLAKNFHTLSFTFSQCCFTLFLAVCSNSFWASCLICALGPCCKIRINAPCALPLSGGICESLSAPVFLFVSLV
ncbi:hypothetical protein GJAV_G00135900, partial [Gymnothorax javanicus]